ERDVWTTAPTVAQALAALGYPSSDFVSVSRSKRLPLSPTSIQLSSPKSVTVTVGSRKQHVVTTALTVSQLLKQLNISMTEQDWAKPHMGTALKSGMTVQVFQIVSKRVTHLESTSYPVIKRWDSSMYTDQSRIIRSGVH